jgi:hypothetical protein
LEWQDAIIGDDIAATIALSSVDGRQEITQGTALRPPLIHKVKISFRTREKIVSLHFKFVELEQNVTDLQHLITKLRCDVASKITESPVTCHETPANCDFPHP